APSSHRRAGSAALNLAVSLDADRATFRGLVLDKFSGRARISAQAVALDPIRFSVFGGRYDGSATFAPASDALAFRARATVGAVQMMASTVNLKGKVQLSDALSQQAGSDVLRYTQESGRVTLPATVAGPIAAPHVGIDTADLTKRAMRNAAADEVQKRLTNDP